MKKTLCALLALACLALLPTPSIGQPRAIDEAVEVVPIPPPPDQPGNDTTTSDDATAEPDDATEPAPQPKPKNKVEPGTMRFHLMDGSIITGKLATDKLPIQTEFGDLVVPVTAIESFAPGLSSHPKLDAKIQALIQQLAAPNAKDRDKAQAELIGYGGGLIAELEAYADDPDAERKARVATIIEALMEEEEDDFLFDGGPRVSLRRLDAIVTERFTVAGSIQQDAFRIESKFGDLEVKLADIKAAERVVAEKPELRKVIDVSGADMAGRSWKNTGLRVNRGDRVIINADGRITMTPWGNNVTTTPDGMPQNGNYRPDIPMGALAGKIGDEEFMVGSKKSFVAQRTGTLYLGFAMQSNWQNYQFPGTFEAKVRVVPVE
ncbi:MAG: hypothetical protein ACE37H_13715 [Phycisphaeraceae bacterium]